jgi:hypothetical protein
MAIKAQENVIELEIAVYNAVLMEVLER